MLGRNSATRHALYQANVCTRGSDGRALQATEGNEKEARTEFTFKYRSILIENAIYTSFAHNGFKISQEDGIEEYPAGS